jgi:hypothetical protein
MIDECPFNVGDRVVFAPDERTKGWQGEAFDRFGVHEGDKGVIARIEGGQYVWLENDRGGFHWQCFKRISS